MRYKIFLLPVLTALISLPSCEKFFEPGQELEITEDKLFDDWYEYRATEMGMYGLQQTLVEQMVVLGELRGDLLTITQNADADLVDIYNFTFTKNNKYASPTNFFKLISACNNFIRILKKEHPEVMDPESPVTNYDKLYGEALCMRAWAYFNAVRIYGKVPFIDDSPSLVTVEEIEKYINTPGTYIDSVYISYGKEGYYNDTLYNYPITLEKNLYDQDLIIDVFTNQLEKEVKAVGVIHYINNNDISWELTIWNTYAMDALLGVMYLTKGDYARAAEHLNSIIINNTDNLRYQLDNSFAYMNWQNIFTNIDGREHIYTIWFNKTYFQQNQLQELFEPWTPHHYMLKPTRWAITNWETVWRNQIISEDEVNPLRTRMIFPGIPSDFYRGYGSSYLYLRNGVPLNEMDYINMLFLRAEEDYRNSRAIMEDVDTIVYKYSINKNRYDQDANFLVYRAAGIHLYLAEIYTWWVFDRGPGPSTFTLNAVNMVNDGTNYSPSSARQQMGVRGRVGLGSGYDAIRVGNINYIHNPFTNEITGYTDLTGNFPAKQLMLEDLILDEKARELAFEGERFYDLMRAAKRRNDPAYLAKRVAAKYPADKYNQIYNYLMDPQNWYINFFE